MLVFSPLFFCLWRLARFDYTELQQFSQPSIIMKNLKVAFILLLFPIYCSNFAKFSFRDSNLEIKMLLWFLFSNHQIKSNSFFFFFKSSIKFTRITNEKSAKAPTNRVLVYNSLNLPLSTHKKILISLCDGQFRP